MQRPLVVWFRRIAGDVNDLTVELRVVVGDGQTALASVIADQGDAHGGRTGAEHRRRTGRTIADGVLLFLFPFFVLSPVVLR